MRDLLAIFVPANRRKLLVAAGVFGAAIALLDWWTAPYISLGFLYLFPIMIIVALLCAGLDFSNLPKNENERFVHLIPVRPRGFGVRDVGCDQARK
jgi:hypothetical protein